MTPGRLPKLYMHLCVYALHDYATPAGLAQSHGMSTELIEMAHVWSEDHSDNYVIVEASGIMLRHLAM